MGERRYDPTTDEWVTFATHRQNRTYLPSTEQCPLCPTRDPRAPTEISRAEFEMAVIDNRFPSLQPDPEPVPPAGTPLLEVDTTSGRCEVIVYSAHHDRTLARSGPDTVRSLIDVWADRYAVLGAEGHAYVLPFENKGEAVGVTLHHPHGQVYAYPYVPPRPLRALATAARHRSATGRCVDCDVVEAELAAGTRIVVAGRSWIAGVPFWARFPYEVRIVARHHVPTLAETDDDARDDLASVLSAVLRALDDLFGFSMPYVMGVFARPTGGSPAAAGWHGDWSDISHLNILVSPPHRSSSKLKHLAGTELMGGAFVTDIAPEQAAGQLRQSMRSPVSER